MTIIKHDGQAIENVTAIRLQPVTRKDRPGEKETSFRVDTPKGSITLTPVHSVKFNVCCSTLRNLQKSDGYFVFPECTEELAAS